MRTLAPLFLDTWHLGRAPGHWVTNQPSLLRMVPGLALQSWILGSLSVPGKLGWLASYPGDPEQEVVGKKKKSDLKKIIFVISEGCFEKIRWAFLKTITHAVQADRFHPLFFLTTYCYYVIRNQTIGSFLLTTYFKMSLLSFSKWPCKNMNILPREEHCLWLCTQS